MSRRQFLHGSARTVAGIASLSAVELIQPRRAAAQQLLPGASTSQPLLLSTSSTRDEGNSFCGTQRLIGRHAYRYDYRFPAGGPTDVPNDVVATYRDGLCDIANELDTVVQPAPFQQPEDVRPEFPPPPSGTDPLQRVFRYRLVQPIDAQSVRVYEWCSFYCGDGSTIIVQVGTPYGHIQYQAMDPGIGPPIVLPVRPYFPVQGVHFDVYVPAQIPDATDGHGYYAAANRQQGWTSETLWQADLGIRDRQSVRVEVHLPGAADPSTRTAQSTYEVVHADGIARVTISQQVSTQTWMNLGEFVMKNGSSTVHLTNETGEPAGEKEIVADAVRWLNA